MGFWGRSTQLTGELKADGHADQHPEPGLLGKQRPDRAQAGFGVGLADRLPHRLVMGGVKPAALRDRRREHFLELRSDAQDHILGLAKLAWVGDLRDRGVQLFVCVGALRHSLGHHTYVAVALTSLSHGAGCGCKLPAAAIGPLLAGLPGISDPNVLVGFENSDDAGVYRLREDLAIVSTVDFFTPIVDDPFEFGRIAACNALSDVYAMGAVPVCALNLVAFSIENVGGEVLSAILRGGASIAAEAGVAIVGGHSIDDPEPKYGMAVTGVVDPRELLTNAGGRAGDALVLTKPLGAGAVSTAVKRGLDAPLAEAVSVMSTLNRDASVAARSAGAHAVTDVTGFGLLGHLHELALASGLAAEIRAPDVPAIDGVLELLGLPDATAVAGGTRRNRTHAESFSSFAPDMPEALRWLVCDAMTSGGLLVSVDEAAAGRIPGALIGRLHEGEPGRISVL